MLIGAFFPFRTTCSVLKGSSRATHWTLTEKYVHTQPADPKCFVCQMLKNRSAEAALCFCDAVTTRKMARVHRCVFSYKGAFDERSDGPFCSPSDQPGAHGSTPFQRAAHRLPDAQSLPSAPGAAAHAARRTAARGEGNMSLI